MVGSHRILVSLAMFLVLSCGGPAGVAATPVATETPSPTPTPTPSPSPTPPPLDAEATLMRSGQVMQALKSFSFTLKHDGGGTAFLPGMVIEEASGSVINPDRVSVSFSGTFGKGYAIRVSLVTLGAASYMTNPLTGAWQALETGVSPLGFFNPSRGISAMMLQLGNVRLLDDGARSGRYRINGDLPVEALAPLLGETLEGVTVRVELAIDSKDLHLLSARLTGRVTGDDPEDIVRVVSVSAFNETLIIEAPELP
jgi:hypothetical protein